MGHCMFLRKGETHTAPLSGILASDIAVGSTVKLMENGVAVDYLVVNQGIPGGSSLYDASCDGMWVLRKDIHSKGKWDGTDNNYKISDIHSWLNGDFFNMLGETEQSVIKQVKIPYVNGQGYGGSVASGASGLTVNVFLLSGYEVGFTTSVNSYFPIDGAKLDYFDTGDTSGGTNRTKRIAYLDGTSKEWWFRSPATNSYTTVCYATPDGSYSSYLCYSLYGFRPALVLPSNALFNKTTLILKGVA